MQAILEVITKGEKTGHELVNSKLSYQFSAEFQLNCEEFLKIAETELDKIDNLLFKTSDQSNSYEISLLLTELNDYIRLFQTIKENFSNLLNSFRGVQVLNEKTLNFYELINQFRSKDTKSNFFDMFKVIVSNSSILCDLFQKEYESIKLADSSQALNETSVKRKTNMDRLNLNIFFNPKRLLKRLLFEKYNLALKNNQKAASIMRTSPTFKFNSPHIIEKNENIFFLEVKKKKFFFLGNVN